MHHQPCWLAIHFNNLVLKEKMQYAFNRDGLYGNVGFNTDHLGLIIEDKGNLSGPARLEVILTVHLEIFIFHLLFFFLVRALNKTFIYSKWSS